MSYTNRIVWESPSNMSLEMCVDFDQIFCPSKSNKYWLFHRHKVERNSDVEILCTYY